MIFTVAQMISDDLITTDYKVVDDTTMCVKIFIKLHQISIAH